MNAKQDRKPYHEPDSIWGWLYWSILRLPFRMKVNTIGSEGAIQDPLTSLGEELIKNEVRIQKNELAKMKAKMTNIQKDFEPCPAQKDFDRWREAKENPCLIMRQTVIVKIEPSKQLSQLCGFPYFIERRYLVGELLELGMITEQDIEHMKSGGEIMKRWRTKI